MKIQIQIIVNKKIAKIIAFVLIAYTISSCSQGVGEVVDLPYTEMIVVRGVLEAGKPVKGIMLTKTLPALDSFEISKAEIQNVDAVIISDNISYKLKSVGNALFDTDSLIAQSGKSYQIIVKWNGKTAYGNTTVPYPVTLDSVWEVPPTQRRRSNQWIYRLSAESKFNENSVIVGGYQLDDTNNVYPFFKSYTSKAYQKQDANSDSKIKLIVFSQNVTDTNNVLFDSLSFKLSFFVESYDIQFYDYFRTRTNGDSPNSSFGLSGSNIHWNIKGDGVGMLIGFASTKKRYLMK